VKRQKFYTLGRSRYIDMFCYLESIFEEISLPKLGVWTDVGLEAATPAESARLPLMK